MRNRFPPPVSRAVNVAVEMRLSVDEAGALGLFVEKFRDLIESCVMSCPEGARDPLLSALGKLSVRLAERAEPFED